MTSHPKAKLGLAGRLVVVHADRAGPDAEGGRGRLRRVAGDGAQVVASLDGRQRSGTRLRWGVWPIAPADRIVPPRQTPGELGGAHLRVSGCATGWGPRPRAIALGVPHSTVWKVLWRSRPSRALEKAPKEEGRALRVAVLRPAACIWTSSQIPTLPPAPGHACHRRSPADRSRSRQLPAARVLYDHAHVIVDDHSRLAYVELLGRRDAPATVTAVRRPRPGLVRRAQHPPRERLMTDGAFNLHPEPLAARTARPRRHPPPRHRALPAPPPTARSSASTRP